MTQALNYTPKAIESLCTIEAATTAVGIRQGVRYLADKLRAAQVFVLPDHGQLLDRSKLKPELPGITLTPPFPVIAAEYAAPPHSGRYTPGYTDSPCSKRIALAWRWADDLPPLLRAMAPPQLADGVVVASIAFYDNHRSWFPVPAAQYFSFEAEWLDAAPTPFSIAARNSGQITQQQFAARKLKGSLIPLLPEMLESTGVRVGVAGLVDTLGSDLMDEVNAYHDLSVALACKNVSVRDYPAPKNLNRQRLKAGKLPLKDFHVLELRGGAEMPGAGHAAGDRAGPRSHLRRGHIRRLDGDRVTWVNSAIVRGRGFVDKVYAA